MVQKIIIFKILPLQLVQLRKFCNYLKIVPHIIVLNQDLRSTAIYGAKIIIFKILPLYIVPLRKSYNLNPHLAAIALVMGQIQKLIGEVLVEISSPLSAHL